MLSDTSRPKLPRKARSEAREIFGVTSGSLRGGSQKVTSGWVPVAEAAKQNAWDASQLVMLPCIELQISPN